MKIRTFISSVLIALSLSATAQSYNYESVPGDPMHARIYTLNNGLKVYLSVNKEKPRIQTYIAVRTGSRNDPAETTGLAHYLEHLMFKGTNRFGTSNPEAEKPFLDEIEKRYEAYRRLTDPVQRKQAYHEIDSVSQLAAQYNIPNEYDKLMASIGAQGTNAYTSNDETVYTEDIPSNEIDNWAKVQAERFQNMVIRGFHTELEAVYEEYNIGIAKDSRKMWKAYFAKLFPGHPYGTQSTIGTQEHLKNPSITNIKNYFKRYYCPNNVAICMAGDLDFDETIAIIERHFGQWKPNNALSYPNFDPVKELTAPTDTTVYGEEAESIWLGWKADAAASAQADTLEVISSLLSNGTAGLLDLNVNQPMRALYTAAGNINMREYSAFILQGAPLEGQSLDDLKAIMLDEVAKLKRGDFSDDLLPSIVANLKLDYQKALESNEFVADQMVNAFIQEKGWKSVATYIDRVEKMTKADIVSFANSFFRDNYAIVYKRQGEDTTLQKIDKPEITGIPTNRDQQSRFVTDIINNEVTPIEPHFVNYDRDLTQGTTKKHLPVLYVENKTNDLFTLRYRYDFGEEADKWLPYAASYIDYLGTDRLTATQLKQQFYKLACTMNVSVGGDNMSIEISGLGENMDKAIALTVDFLQNMKVDQDAYDSYVGTCLKSRTDNKLNQSYNYGALCQYGQYGPYNPYRNVPDSTELVQKNPQELVDIIKALRGYEHTILYYGPTSLKNLIATIDKQHKTAKKLSAVPAGREYTNQPTPENEIILAPYEAKNIYMRMYHNEGRQFNADDLPVIALFNEYYGGSMNSVVFQELREARGLAYSASARYATPQRLSGTECAFANIISQNDKMMDCIRTFHQILDTIPQSDKAFLLAKQGLQKQLATVRTTKMGIINNYLATKRLGLTKCQSEIIYDKLPSITLQDIVKYEQEQMANKSWHYLILGDEKELDIESLEKIAPIRRVSTEEIFGY